MDLHACDAARERLHDANATDGASPPDTLFIPEPIRILPALGGSESPERAKREFVAACGGMRAIGGALRERMRPRAQQILGREPGDDELQRWSNKVRLLALAEWPTAPEGTFPNAHLDHMVEAWAADLRKDTNLSCWDVGLIPVFAFGLPAVALSAVLPDELALLGGLLLAVPLMMWWVRGRRSGRIPPASDD